MPFFSKVRHQLIAILTLCEPSKKIELQVKGASTNFRRGDYTIEDLKEQQAWIHEKALADASYPSTPGYRLTRSSLPVISPLPRPMPGPFCEEPRQVPPFPVRRCISNPCPQLHARHGSPIVRSQSTEDWLHRDPSYSWEYYGSKYAPRYQPVEVEALPQPLHIPETSHDPRASQDSASRPTSFYSQFSRPSSEVLPNEESTPHIPLPHYPRIGSRYRPLSLDSIPSLPSLPKSRPTSFQTPRLDPIIYDQLVDSEMGVNVSDMSLVEPCSFYQDGLDASFLQVAQATTEAKSAWSTRSSLGLEEGEMNDGNGTEDDFDVSRRSFDSKMQEAILISERCTGIYV